MSSFGLKGVKDASVIALQSSNRTMTNSRPRGLEKFMLDAMELHQSRIEDGDEVGEVQESVDEWLLINWLDLEDPMKWLSSDPGLRALFDSFFAKKNEKLHLNLFRGTDYEPIYGLKAGDSIDYSDRYTSWTTEEAISRRFVIPGRESILVFPASIQAVCFDMTKSGLRTEEKEHIMGSVKLVVTSVEVAGTTKIFYVALC